MSTRLLCLLFLLVLPAAVAELLPPVSRAPQFPLKTARTLLSGDELTMARQNIEQYDAAKAIANKIIEHADAWVEWDDSALRQLVPTADVPRAFNVGTAGCPKCGQEIYAKGGTYPWIIDPKTPFKVTCPVDGSTYPSNDYAAYFASGLEDPALLTGDYPDDGWGWVGPDGHRYWFVAYANHWMWENHLIPALQYLGRAYLLTGEVAYAHKAVLLLDRIAEVYPNMDYHGQSRYGQLQEANGSRYEGKIVNHIWETGVLTTLAEAYDFVWEAIDDDSVPGKRGEELRANIEANLLEEGIDAYFSGKIRGNFGMHQKALVYAGLVRQYGRQQEWFDGLLNDAGASYAMTGLNYALYNLVYRDGAPYETSPGYNFSWVVNITTVAEALKRAGYDVYAIPKTRRLYDAVLDVVNAGAYTPSLGDSGSVHGGLVGQNAFVYQSAYRALGNARFHAHLQSFGATGPDGFATFESLFKPVIEEARTQAAKLPSRLLDGYGMAILNNPSDTVSLALYYGYAGGHGHYDRLHFELFANGQVMMPDTGYPDFMNAYVPGIYTWSKNTIAHNTLTVDASRQTKNRQGRVNLFVDHDFARALDIDAAETYEETGEYRRRLFMIDLDGAASYVVDCFTVDGGEQHDYSLHGPLGTFAPISGSWSEPAEGTLAGAGIPLGQIYDDPKLAVEGFTGSYADYRGSGFQHLFNVQRLNEGPAVGEWTHEREEAAKLRVHLVDVPDEVFAADAQVSPVKQKELLKYLIARNKGAALKSRFVSVLEPFSGTASIGSIRNLELLVGEGSALAVERADASTRDIVLINTGGGEMAVADPAIRTDAAFAVLRYAGQAEARRWIAGGSYLAVGDAMARQEAAVRGEVIRVEPETGRVLIRLESEGAELEALPGRVAHFENTIRRTAHPIESIEATEEGLVLTVRDDLRVGRVRIASVEADRLTTATGFAFAPVYDGAYVCDMDYAAFQPLRRVAGGALEFAGPMGDALPFESGKDAWIVDIGPGDSFEVTSVTAFP